jgi:hypothetical protein
MKISLVDAPGKTSVKTSSEPPHRFVRGADGRLEKRYVLDTANPEFDEQFLTVFRRNVERARRRQGRGKRAVAAE